MGKYQPITRVLSEKGGDLVTMSFKDIEELLGFTLPASARAHRAWWSNNPINNVMTKAWLEAGYETSDVDLSTEKLTFRRKSRETRLPQAGSASEQQQTRPRHPLFGSMKGTFTILPGTDLTAPADPDWGKVYDD